MTEVVLIFPPLWDPYGPPASTAALVGHLRANGVGSIQVDLNAIYFKATFERFMATAAADVTDESAWAKRLPYEHKVVLGNARFQPGLFRARGIHPSMLTFDGFRRGIAKGHLSVLNAVDAMIHYGYFVRNCPQMSRAEEDPGVLDDGVWQEMRALFLASCLTLIAATRPRLVGFSILGEQQLPAAIACSTWLRERYDGPIVWGGSQIQDTFDRIVRERPWWKELPDHLCLGEGETALLELARRARAGRPLVDGIEGWRSRPYALGLPTKRFEAVDALAAPTFDGFDLADGYLMPETIVPYQASRGCHWGICAFCDHEEGYRLHYRPKDPRIVVDQWHSIWKTHGVTHFQLVDEAIEPSWFARLLDELERRGLKDVFRWSNYSKISGDVTYELLKRAQADGCRMILFGVETLVPRLIKLVKKGTTKAEILRTLADARRAGIRPCIWLISGLPTQTPEELHEDVDDMEALFPTIDAAFVSRYRISANSDIYRNLASFGILKFDLERPTDVVYRSGQRRIDPEDLKLIFFERYYPRSIALSRSHNRYLIYQDALNVEKGR